QRCSQLDSAFFRVYRHHGRRDEVSLDQLDSVGKFREERIELRARGGVEVVRVGAARNIGMSPLGLAVGSGEDQDAIRSEKACKLGDECWLLLLFHVLDRLEADDEVEGASLERERWLRDHLVPDVRSGIDASRKLDRLARYVQTRSLARDLREDDGSEPVPAR